jgi:CheY-like chemotaxis protein
VPSKTELTASGVTIERLSPLALVVDREPTVRSTVKSVLSGLGFRVVDTPNGLYALSLAQSKPSFDLLVTETQPKGIDGKTLAESFLLASRLGRVVMMSAADDVDAVNGESAGAWVFVPKQRLAELLVEAIRDIGMAQPERVVLLVDDEPQMRTLLRTILVQAGYAVISAADGQEALELSRAYTDAIDLLVSDILMPRMSGTELAEYMHQERPNTNVLLMSGHASAALRQYLSSHDFIQKPFAPGGFIKQVSRSLKRS